MTLSFPSSPINGAVSGDYTYDAAKTAWRKNGAYPVSVTHSDVAPSNPRAGDQWWKSNEGTLFTYYNDGTSSQWVESTNVVANVEPNPIPAGAMMAWGSDVIPANWLLCDGAAVSRSTYASLFAIIGTQYGSGDGVTTFNLPNIKGRTIVGKDASQTEFDVLGETGGAKTHTLTSAQIPSHTHTYSGSTNTTGAHTHSLNGKVNISQNGYGQNSPINGNAGNFADGTAYSAGDHSHTFSGTTAANTGGDGSHNNLQPYIVLNYIIKYSAGETPGDSQLATRMGVIETGIRAVTVGGTGVSSLTSGAYLKGAGTSAITAQTGIPAGDITSGQIDFNRLPSGSAIQVGGVNTSTTLAGTMSGAVLTSFTFAPKLANSKLLLQSSAVVVGEYNNVDNEFYMAAYRDGNLISLSRQTAGHFHFSGSLNVGWMSFNHYFTSWGTNSATIEIKIGNSSSMYANYPYYTNSFTNGTAGFSIIEFMP